MTESHSDEPRREQPKSDRQRQADEIVARSAKRDGSLGSYLDTPDDWHSSYLDWEPGEEAAGLDGRFSAEILIAIGDHMLANAKRKGEGR